MTRKRAFGVPRAYAERATAAGRVAGSRFEVIPDAARLTFSTRRNTMCW